MRNPENVLNSLREHSAHTAYVYDRVYRNLYNPALFLQAYQNIYANKGSMTPGVDGQTFDAMSMERIERLIAALRDESYHPTPAKRTYIPKKNGKLRPLGIPSVDDRLVQEVARMLLESIYESNFEDTSHGFRPDRSCHTALRQVQNRFTRCKWFVEGDIKAFFDNIDHNVMIRILGERIKDERFLRLIRKFLKAGYMEEMQFHSTYSGTPQGGVISPLLANIYLDQLDKYIVEYKQKFDMGKKRAVNKEYSKLSDRRHRLLVKMNKAVGTEKERLQEEIRELDKIHLSIPCKDPTDGNFRRLQYVRYADDFLVGIIGAKADAERIKADLHDYLSDKLMLELSEEKTLVTNATNGARFLGFDVRAREQSNLTRKTKHGRKARNYGGHIVLEVPTDLIQKKLLELGAMKINVANGAEIWKSTHRSKLVCREDWVILEQYNGEIRGFCNFYAIANNRSKLHKFRCVMEYSLYKTLACKYRTSKKKIIDKYRYGKDFGIPYQDKHGNDKVRLLWKGSLAKDSFPKEVSVDLIHKPKGILKKPILGQRLTSGRCEWCGAVTQDLVVHQVKSLKNLDDRPPWAAYMKKINRRTLVVCKTCHSYIHMQTDKQVESRIQREL